MSQIETGKSKNGKRNAITPPSPAHERGAGGEGSSSAVERLLGDIDPKVARVLDRALAGEDISVEEGTALLDAQGSANVNAIALAADDLRRRTVGDVVTYIINRNINFTNVCIKHCTFCAFSRGHREEEAYYLPVEEIVRRAREAWDMGATEVCIQAGLPPKMKGDYYIELTRAIKKELPELHIQDRKSVV